MHTTCSAEGLSLKLAGTGVLFIHVNGQSLVSWGEGWPMIHTINISPRMLMCGCNTIKICVYNYYFGSPAALVYSVHQQTQGCYDCMAAGMVPMVCNAMTTCPEGQHLNKYTCRCQCNPKCCKSGWSQNM